MLGTLPRGPTPLRSFWGATLLLGVLVTGEGMTGAHELLVSHSLCREHGEVVHGQTVIAPALDSARAGIANTEPAASIAREHEHCRLAGGSPRIQAPQRSRTFAGRLHPRHPVVPLRSESVTSVRLFRLAPKNSPPALL